MANSDSSTTASTSAPPPGQVVPGALYLQGRTGTDTSGTLRKKGLASNSRNNSRRPETAQQRVRVQRSQAESRSTLGLPRKGLRNKRPGSNNNEAAQEEEGLVGTTTTTTTTAITTNAASSSLLPLSSTRAFTVPEATLVTDEDGGSDDADKEKQLMKIREELRNEIIDEAVIGEAVAIDIIAKENDNNDDMQQMQQQNSLGRRRGWRFLFGCLAIILMVGIILWFLLGKQAEEISSSSPTTSPTISPSSTWYPTVSPTASSCVEGYTCWEDRNGGLWAKKDSEAVGLDCDSVCFNAFAGGSDIYTCENGVAAPKDASDLAEVVFGQENFNCDGSPSYPTQCWGNQSPEILSGTILVTGNANDFSKNCYYPSELVLSCDVPNHANCFGERFASICPCIRQEEHKITESKNWRLYTHSDYDKEGRPTWSWDLDNINFYSSSDCRGGPLDLPDEPTKFTDSGNGGNDWTPERAFGNNSGTWGGRFDSRNEGNMWIAVEFPTAVKVGCVQFDQSDHNYATHVELQATGRSTIWQTIEFVSNGRAGTNKIRFS